VRVLASADIHGHHEVYDWLVTVAQTREVSAVILAGDLLGYPDGYETPELAQEADREPVLKILGRLSQPVFYIMGNDDWVELRSPVLRHRPLHGDRVDFEGFNFVGYQFTLPFMGGRQ